MYWRKFVTAVEVAIASVAAISKVALSNGHCIQFRMVRTTSGGSFSRLAWKRPFSYLYVDRRYLMESVCDLQVFKLWQAGTVNRRGLEHSEWPAEGDMYYRKYVLALPNAHITGATKIYEKLLKLRYIFEITFICKSTDKNEIWLAIYNRLGYFAYSFILCAS